MANSHANGTWNFGMFESVDPFFSTSSMENADDWGDFVMTPVGSNNTSHPFVQPTVASFTNPIGLDNSSNLASHLSYKDGNAGRWEKIKGAIPLSIFGLEEEEMEKGETNGFPADKNGAVKNDVRSEIDHGANNMIIVPNGLDKLLEGSAEMPDLVKGNDIPELEVLTKGDGDELSAKISGLPDNKLDWNPLVLKEKATGFESLQDLDVLVNGDNSHNAASGDSDEDDWEFKNAEVETEAAKGDFTSIEVVSPMEGQAFFGDIGSMWPSVATDFGVSKSVETNKSSSWFINDIATNKRINDGIDLLQFQSFNSKAQAANNPSLEDNLPGMASIISSLTDTLETTETKVDDSDVTLHNKSTEADVEEEEEWSFHAAKADDNFEQPRWNTLNSNSFVVKEENTSSSNGVSNDIWAQELWNFKDFGVGNSSSSQGNQISANENLASLSDSDVSQLPSSRWDFTLDIPPSAETANKISNITPRGKVESYSFFSPIDDSHAFEENSWAFVGTESSENKSEALSEDTGKKFSETTPRGNGETYSFFLPDSESHVSEENSWSFVGAEVLENKSKAAIAEPGNKTADVIPGGSREEENSWGFVAAEVSENKAEAISTPSKTKALPLSIFGEETEFDTPVLNNLADNSNSNTGSNINYTNVTIEDIVSSLYNQMETNTPTKQSNNDIENPGLPAEVEIINHSVEGHDSDDDAWDFQEPSMFKEDDDAWGFQEPAVFKEDDDVWDFQEPAVFKEAGDHDEYVDVFEKLREKLTLAELENHKTERSQALDAIVKDSDDSDAGIQDIDASQEGSIPNAQNLSELFSEIVTILKDPKFQMFESEYGLSTALFTAEKDFECSNALLKDVTSILKILKLSTKENRQKFVVVWSKILVACLHELTHGASIWKDLVEINAHNNILLESRGKDFVISLREIYRVVEMVKASSKIYKPWLCTLPFDSSNVLSSIDQSDYLWASSGLQEAYDTLEGSSSAALETNIESPFDCASPLCHLSLLPESVMPNVQMVEWNGKSYFVNVANLWANLVHCEPPMLPTLCFASSNG